MKTVVTWSYGGGWQSVAIGVLIKKGILPVPDMAAICDTSRERRTTWNYLRDHMQPYLKGIVDIEVVPHTFARVDLYDKTGLTVEIRDHLNGMIDGMEEEDAD